MVQPVDTIVYGLGPIGRRLAGVAARKQSLRLVGAVDISPDIVGRHLDEIVPGAQAGIIVSARLEEVLRECRPTVALHATGSYILKVEPQLQALLQAGISVVSTCEELAFAPADELSGPLRRLDALAKASDARLLGTGINPGFAMDVWPLIATASHGQVRRVEVTRVLDAATRREPLQRKIGSGMAAGDFRAAVAAGTLGHVGLRTSAQMLARGLGQRVVEVQESTEPVLAEGEVVTDHFRVPAGMVVGLSQHLECRLTGDIAIVLHLEMYLGAKSPRDEVAVHGDRVARTIVEGGFAGDPATAALVANAVLPLLACQPGYRTMLELPLFGCAP